MGWRCVAAVAAAFAVSGVLPGPARMADAAGRGVGPLEGLSTIADTGLRSFGSMLADDSTGRVYISSPSDGTVVMLAPDGSIGARRSGLAGIDDLVLAGGALYGLQTGLGRVVRIDRATLAPTTVADGLSGPRGLATLSGSLVTTTQTWTEFLLIDPVTGSVAPVTTGAPIPTNRLFSSPAFPDVIYGWWENEVPGPLFRYTPATHTAQTCPHQLTARPSLLADGTMLVPSRSGASTASFSPVTCEPDGRRWRVDEPVLDVIAPPPALQGVSASGPAVSLLVNSGSSVQVRIDDVVNTARNLRTYDLGAVVAVNSGIVLFRSGSRLVVLTVAPSGTVEARSMPGVGPSSVPSAPGSPVASRGSAPAAGGTGTPRAPAPAATPPIAPLRDVADIEFDEARGLVYVADPVGDGVNVYRSSGAPFTRIGPLAGVSSLTMLGGSVFGALRDQGSVVRLDASRAEAQIVASGLEYPEELVGAGGRLWLRKRERTSDAAFVGIDPVTGAIAARMLGPAPLSDPVGISERPYGSTIYVGTVRLDAITGAQVASAPAPLPPPGSRRPVRVLVVPGAGQVIDSVGTGRNAETLEPDGTAYIGGPPFAVSGTGGWVVSTGLGTTNGIPSWRGIYVMQQASGALLRTIEVPASHDIRELEFRPGTSILWAAIDKGSAVQVGPLLDVATGQLLAPL